MINANFYFTLSKNHACRGFGNKILPITKPQHRNSQFCIAQMPLGNFFKELTTRGFQIDFSKKISMFSENFQRSLVQKSLFPPESLRTPRWPWSSQSQKIYEAISFLPCQGVSWWNNLQTYPPYVIFGTSDFPIFGNFNFLKIPKKINSRTLNK